MYPNPLITPSLVRQTMEETQKAYSARPMPDAYWYEPRAKQPLWPSHKPRTAPTPEEACGCEAC